MSLTRVIEALLFSGQKPLSIQEITAAIKGADVDPASGAPNEFARVKNAQIAAALEELKVEYIKQSRAFQLIEKQKAGNWLPIPALRNGSGSFFRRRSRRV